MKKISFKKVTTMVTSLMSMALLLPQSIAADETGNWIQGRSGASNSYSSSTLSVDTTKLTLSNVTAVIIDVLLSIAAVVGLIGVVYNGIKLYNAEKDGDPNTSSKALKGLLVSIALLGIGTTLTLIGINV